MTNIETSETLVREYSANLLEHLRKNTVKGPRTYGFEYEFLSEHPLNLAHMEALYRFLPEIGYEKSGDNFWVSSGPSITFEPGGQIEYHSTPMLPDDDSLFDLHIAQIRESNEKIRQQLGISYIAKDYLPGRLSAPLCLTSGRYKNLHERLSYSGTRGLEMMKGTASIHLHVAIRSMDEVVSLFSALKRMSGEDTFKMGAERRDIWNNTDETRCGLPSAYTEDIQDPEKVIENIVRYTVDAFDISEKRPFRDVAETSFESFLYHMTTIFTDIRLNVKGPTFEVRTLDSIPFDEFKRKWKAFAAQLEKIEGTK